jgi:hypothetical protein
MEKTRWTQGFTWFRPPKRNTLHPQRGLLYRCVFFKLGFSWREATWFESMAVHPFIAQDGYALLHQLGLQQLVVG